MIGVENWKVLDVTDKRKKLKSCYIKVTVLYVNCR